MFILLQVPIPQFVVKAVAAMMTFVAKETRDKFVMVRSSREMA